MADLPDAVNKPTTGRRWPWITALIFVTATLMVLVATPLLVQRSVDRHRSRIASSEPARTLLMGLQFNLAREMASLTQFTATGEQQQADVFRFARENERRIWSDLEPLVTELGSAVHGRYERARTQAEFWHDQLNEEAVLRNRSAGGSLLREPEVQQRFEQMLRTTSELDSLIVVATQTNRVSITNAERLGMWLTLISGALAFLAAIVVGWLVRRIQRLAFEAEQRRQQAAEALAESARAAEGRTRLLSGITHDVKNPLGAARGYAELLNMEVKGTLNPDQEKLVAGVERSIDNALAIISDLLDLARADSGSITIHRINVDLRGLARQALEDHKPAAEAAGHTIHFDDVDGELNTYTDPVRVRQVLDNLISNAIKYTPAPGRITIATDGDAPDAPFDKRAVAIRVSDNGPGIAPEMRDAVFDEFTRLHDGSAMKGHGLGLSIAQRIARLLGGDLGLANSRTPGATFTIWLPQREQREFPREMETTETAGMGG